MFTFICDRKFDFRIVWKDYRIKTIQRFAVAASLMAALAIGLSAQNISRDFAENRAQNPTAVKRSEGSNDSAIANRSFRIEALPVSGGSELITIFARTNIADSTLPTGLREVPLVSVLRDTLGDDRIENDRLRFLWVLTYANPSFSQKFAASIPFLYRRTTNKKNAGKGPPRPVADISPINRNLWNKIFLRLLKKFIVDDFVLSLRLPTLQYKKNADNYKRSAIAQALALLAVFQSTEGEKVLSESELRDIQARLMLKDDFLGSLMTPENLGRLYLKSAAKKERNRSRNWELLRQQCEAQKLYFEPLEMPDGSATHAVVWVDEADLERTELDHFNSRFLNIKSPWGDPRLMNWEGFSKTVWFDEDNRIVEPETPNTIPKKLIPLALYGLDHPKIPIVLIDFRDTANPKKREMSKRILDDLTQSILQVSVFSNSAVFFGRYVFDFVMHRKGIDIGQGTRLKSYAQLKLLVMLNRSLDPGFGKEVAQRVEMVSLNPLQNDLEVEVKLARAQYENLVSYAKDPKGLEARVRKERGREMVRLKHNGTERFFLKMARVFSFGFYEHREKITPDLLERLDIERQLRFHERNLIEIARESVKPDVDADVTSLSASLLFISQNEKKVGSKTVEAIAKVFTRTNDRKTRELCLISLYRINNRKAIRELLDLYKDENTESDWRSVCARYLRRAVTENPEISSDVLEQISDLAID